MVPASLSWVDAKFVQEVLRSSENDDTIEVNNITTRLATATGDNYMSVIIRANVEYSCNKSVCKSTIKKSILIKVAPTIEGRKDFLTTLDVFDIEIKMMQNTLVKMNALLEVEGHRLSARALFTKTEDPALIVMEDLAPLGYRMADRCVGLDLEHGILAMRGLARFHAASVALSEKDPTATTTYNQHIFMSEIHKDTCVFPALFAIVAKELINWSELGSSRYRYAEKMEKLSEIFVERFRDCVSPKDDEFNVLNHGDCWLNNMLFRYSDDGKVVDHIFVDFQMSILSSPALDIFYFMNTSLSEVVELHYHGVILEEYLKVLTETMTRLQCKTKAPDMAGLNIILQKYRLFEIMASVITLPFALLDKSEVKSIDEIIKEGEAYVNPAYKEMTYRKIMIRRFLEWDVSGALDF